MINFIVSGLDGILIHPGEKTVSEDIIERIQELKKRGVLFAVASGINYDAVAPLFGKVKNDIVYICNDGGVIIYQDRVVSKTPVDRLVLHDIVNEIRREGKCKLVVAGERNALTSSKNYDFIKYFKSKNVELEQVEEVKTVHGDVTKITIYCPDGLDYETYENFFNKWSKKANVAVSNPNEAYVTGEYVTKGNALALVQHIFEISEEDTLVFARGYSDMDMFEHTYFSYAMQDADPEVKREAKHIAENINTILDDILMMR